MKDAGIPEASVHYVMGPIEEEAVQKRLVDETVAKFGHLDVLVSWFWLLVINLE